MPLWLELLRTPMAAPETSGLRRMRLVWQILCLSLAATLISLEEIQAAAPHLAVPLAGALLVAVVLHTAVYWSRKNRADRALIASREGKPQ